MELNWSLKSQGHGGKLFCDHNELRERASTHTSLLFPPEPRTMRDLVLSGACSYVPWLSIGLAFPLYF